jgi:hypothetical protein
VDSATLTVACDVPRGATNAKNGDPSISQTWVSSEIDLAVGIQSARLGIGTQLMARAHKTATTIRGLTGCAGMVVDAKKCSRADNYYRRMGFGEIRDQGDSVLMYMELAKP